MNRSLRVLALLLAVAGGILAVGLRSPSTPAQAPANLMYALTESQHLITFRSDAPQEVTNDVPVAGLFAGESLIGVDVRPVDGLLYGAGSGPASQHLYVISPQTGVATAVSPASIGVTFNGTQFGFDFNPTVDRIRVVSNTAQNLRLNPVTGALTGLDNPLNYAAGDPNFGAPPSVVGVAYTNNVATAVTTALYDIDSNLDILALQVNPNGGILNTVGPLGVDTLEFAGFDIAPDGRVFATLTPAGSWSGLYTIDLATGAASLAGGQIGNGFLIHGLAVGPVAPVVPTPIPTPQTNPTPTPSGTPAPTASPSPAPPAAIIVPITTSVVYEGTITIDGRPATAGNAVIAMIGSQICGDGSVVSSGRYRIAVASDVTSPGCGRSGATVRFSIIGRQANETATFGDARTTTLNLTIGGMPSPGPSPAP